jgi:hypothetical protein
MRMELTNKNQRKSNITNKKSGSFSVAFSWAHKSFTAALVALGCVVSRPATDAVKKGSQIADRFTINRFSGKQKRTRFQCFHIS